MDIVWIRNIRISWHLWIPGSHIAQKDTVDQTVSEEHSLKKIDTEGDIYGRRIRRFYSKE